MAVNILETVKGYLTPDLISRASSMLGESEGGVSKALSGLVPAVFGGLISKATSGSHAGANEVLALSKESYQGGFPGNITNMLGGGLPSGGTSMLENFFGNKFQSIISAIASFAGIKTSSANSLFNVATPLATGALGRYAVENNLDAHGLSSFLQSQKSNVAAMLPAGLPGKSLGFGWIGQCVICANRSKRDGKQCRRLYHRYWSAGKKRTQLACVDFAFGGSGGVDLHSKQRMQ